LSLTHLKSGSTLTSALLFLIVFGIWQAYDLFMASFFLTSLFIYVVYFAIFGACLTIFILFVKLGKSDLGKHGFKPPSNVRKCMLLSISSIVLYIFATLIPGFMFGFGSRPSPGILAIPFNIIRAIIISLTTESIFRGYIFKNLARAHGFFTALYASSIMFGLHRYDDPVSIINLLNMSTDKIISDVLFTQIMPAFMGGLFLGFMFYKMDWSLLGPIIFHTGILLYYPLSPITVNVPWWTGLTFEVTAYLLLFMFTDSAIKEPSYRKKRYGLES